MSQERRGEERLPTEQEVRQRLQRLKGSSPAAPPAAPRHQAPDTRTAEQRSSELLGAVSAEVALEARHPVLSPEQDIAARLARLRGEPEPRQERQPEPSEYLGGGQGGGEEELDQVARLMVAVQREAEREARGALEELERDQEIQVGGRRLGRAG